MEESHVRTHTVCKICMYIYCSWRHGINILINLDVPQFQIKHGSRFLWTFLFSLLTNTKGRTITTIHRSYTFYNLEFTISQNIWVDIVRMWDSLEHSWLYFLPGNVFALELSRDGEQTLRKWWFIPLFVLINFSSSVRCQMTVEYLQRRKCL